MISPPACYGKLPALGDYFQYNASQEEVSVWWNRFFKLQGHGWNTVGPSPVPWCFVLPPDIFSWSGTRHVVGSIVLSEDRIGRRYPFVVWQKASTKALRLSALFGAGLATNWLFWVSRLVAVHVLPRRSGGATPSVQDFERQLLGLWDMYKPDWRVRLGIMPAPPENKIVAKWVEKLPPCELEGVHHMPWADWPERLLNPKAPCCFWQQDHHGKYLRVVENKRFGVELIPMLLGD